MTGEVIYKSRREGAFAESSKLELSSRIQAVVHQRRLRKMQTDMLFTMRQRTKEQHLFLHQPERVQLNLERQLRHNSRSPICETSQ